MIAAQSKSERRFAMQDELTALSRDHGKSRRVRSLCVPLHNTAGQGRDTPEYYRYFIPSVHCLLPVAMSRRTPSAATEHHGDELGGS
jgi:hypothetical protein